jgi:hypothetical protein
VIARELRAGLLAVSVLDDVDLVPWPGSRDGVTVRWPEGDELALGWDEVAQVVGTDPPTGPVAVARLRRWVARRHACGDLSRLVREARAVGLPTGHACHPGASWARLRVLGGDLDVGLGVRDLDGEDTGVAVTAPDLLAAAGAPVDLMWQRALDHVLGLGRLAADLLRSDRYLTLRPVGGVDVPTLLAVPEYRAALADADGYGIRTVAVPTRDCGWVDLGRIDPDFVRLAAQLTDPVRRGFPRPLLVTRDEVVMARARRWGTTTLR